MKKKTLKPYPSWVCFDCGVKASEFSGRFGMNSTYHMGKCDVCGKKKAVTQPRDFGYPQFP